MIKAEGDAQTVGVAEKQAEAATESLTALLTGFPF
jgi:hypothetical protein